MTITVDGKSGRALDGSHTELVLGAMINSKMVAEVAGVTGITDANVKPDIAIVPILDPGVGSSPAATVLTLNALSVLLKDGFLEAQLQIDAMAAIIAPELTAFSPAGTNGTFATMTITDVVDNTSLVVSDADWLIYIGEMNFIMDETVRACNVLLRKTGQPEIVSTIVAADLGADGDFNVAISGSATPGPDAATVELALTVAQGAASDMIAALAAMQLLVFADFIEVK